MLAYQPGQHSKQEPSLRYVPGVRGMPNEAARYGSHNILVVDDEAPIAQFVCDLLSEEGYSVRVEHDGASALLEVLRHPPDLILLDVAMPVMTGDELLRTLRAEGYDSIPVIVMTASMKPSIYREAGATDILPKPFDITQLLGKIQQYLPLES
jgi:CheY-like chemotaxis protein